MSLTYEKVIPGTRRYRELPTRTASAASASRFGSMVVGVPTPYEDGKLGNMMS